MLIQHKFVAPQDGGINVPNKAEPRGKNQHKFLASQDGWTKFLTQSSLPSVYFCIFIILEYWKIENSHLYWATNSI